MLLRYGCAEAMPEKSNTVFVGTILSDTVLLSGRLGHAANRTAAIKIKNVPMTPTAAHNTARSAVTCLGGSSTSSSRAATGDKMLGGAVTSRWLLSLCPGATSSEL